MRTFLKSFSMMAIAAVAGVSVTSCTSDKDLYNPEVVKENVKAEYAANFVKAFGEVSPTKNWDMSNYKAQIVTRSVTEITTEHVAGFDFGVKLGQVTKNKTFYNEITNSILKEGVKKTGKPAVLLAPDNDFTIYPLATQTSNAYKMYVKVGDNNPIEVFDKSWTDHEKLYVNKMKKDMPGLHVVAPVGTAIEIYIQKRDGSVYGTSNGMAITVESQIRPEGVDPDATIKYVGIEDWNSTASDWDYNDLVIAIIGNPDAPEPIIIKDEYYYKEIARPAKRYMIEDLGTTDDFDFNDVVVDVMDIISEKHHVTIVNGRITNDEVVQGADKHEQKAFIRALGGTLDFILQIGNTTWKKSSDFTAAEMINTETPEFGKLLKEIDVTGWEPELNNVSLMVVDDLGNTIEFPKTGAIPMMFATSTRTNWMIERHRIPTEWTVE